MGDQNVSETSASFTLERTVQSEPLLWHVVGAGERIFAGLLLALAFPLLVAAALIIVILSRQSPLIAHRRVSQYGRDLWLLKLRTMWNGRHLGRRNILVEKIPDTGCRNPPVKTSRDPRVTSSFATFCRCYSIDELPQLWQVVCGQLALVGPRPLTKCEIEQYYSPNSTVLLSRKPGITGLWQVSGRSRLNYAQRRRLDLFLIRKWSLPLYFLILARTVYRTPLGKDAW